MINRYHIHVYFCRPTWFAEEWCSNNVMLFLKDTFVSMYVIRHPNSYGYNYHHMRRICHILFPNFRRHHSQCFKNYLWLNLWINDNLAISSFIKIRMQYPFDRKFLCSMKCASKWNAPARVTCQHHWARIVYAPSISFYFLALFVIKSQVGKINGEMPVSISSAIYKLHAS